MDKIYLEIRLRMLSLELMSSRSSGAVRDTMPLTQGLSLRLPAAAALRISYDSTAFITIFFTSTMWVCVGKSPMMTAVLPKTWLSASPFTRTVL